MSHPDREGATSGRASSSIRLSKAPFPTLPQSDSSKPSTSNPAPNLSLQSRRALPVPKSFPPLVSPIHPSILNITPSNTKRTTYRIHFKTSDLNKRTDRQQIFEVTFRLHRTLAAGCTYRKTIINQKRDDEQKQKEQQTHNTYREITKHAIQQTKSLQHALTLSNQTHLKLTALILEAHIAALDKTQKFGDILSKSLKTNFDIDTTFPDRDSAAIYNFYYDKTGIQQPHTKQALSQETQKSHEAYKLQEPLKPQEQQSL
ncbi:hypothetical protein FHG87_015535 [Trinorchestia longiramus]|nr:hypothetical protein FHG87_015535 [Trinorchestia longiramus]